MGAKRPSASALGGKSNVKPNGRRRCDGADYETVSPIISKKVYGNSWEILFYDLPILQAEPKTKGILFTGNDIFIYIY